MSTGKIIWRQDHWLRGRMVKEFPRLRVRYGRAMAAVVELWCDRMSDEAERPRGQDKRETLEKIINEGKGECLVALPGIDELLLAQSLALFNTEHYERLPAEGLRMCAKAALDSLPKTGGAPRTDLLAVPLVNRLSDLWFRRLRHRELNLMRKRQVRPYPAIPKSKGPPTAAERARLEREEYKMMRRALRSCGFRGLTDSNIARLLNKPG